MGRRLEYFPERTPGKRARGEGSLVHGAAEVSLGLSRKPN